MFVLDLPVSSQVTRATPKEPYLGLTLELDPAPVAELAKRVYPRGVPKTADKHGLYVGRSTDAIVEAVSRLLELMAHLDDANLLGPLVVDEIVIRLLRTPVGKRIAQIGQAKSGVQRVAEAASWIRSHCDQPVTVDEMAHSVHMSASSFHQRFKAVTSMSPMQYQKVLDPGVDRTLVTTRNRFFAETGWQPVVTKPVAGALPYTRYNWFIRRTC